MWVTTCFWILLSDLFYHRWHRCLRQPCFHRVCPISFGGLRCLLLSCLCKSRKAGDGFGVVPAGFKAPGLEQPCSAGWCRMGRGEVVPASPAALPGDPCPVPVPWTMGATSHGRTRVCVVLEVPLRAGRCGFSSARRDGKLESDMTFSDLLLSSQQHNETNIDGKRK